MSSNTVTTNTNQSQFAANPSSQSNSQQPQSTATPSGTTPQQPYTSASLYVGDLAPDVTEALLFEIFNAVGPVQSVRVCRDVTTRRSLGYSYVNFHRLEDAERALDTLNFKLIRGRPCRIMWSHRDPTLRKTGLGNIFVKGLQPSIDNKQLYDTFSMFGNILSCKVAQDSERASLGYGFVHYEEEGAAQAAIQRVDGKMIAGGRVNVQQFKPKTERGNDSTANTFTNVFIKNLPAKYSQAQLDELFKPYGSITSSMLVNPSEKNKAAAADNSGKADGANSEQKEGSTEPSTASTTDSTSPSTNNDSESQKTSTPSGKPLGCYGFVNFENSDDAERAVNELNGKGIDGQEIYVGRAVKKQERSKLLAEQFNNIRLEKQQKYAGINLYVKNLSDDIDDDKLQQEFSKFGTITSAKIMRDAAGKTRGFGFVCYATPDEATKAVTSMNGQMFQGKPLYVALAQRKDQRHEQLQAQYAQRAKMGFGLPGMNGFAGTPGQFGMQPGQQQPGYPYQPGFTPFQQARTPFPGQPLQGGMQRQPFLPGQPQGQYNAAMSQYNMLPGQQRPGGVGGMPGQQQQPGMLNGRGGGVAGRGGRGGMMGQQPQPYPGQQIRNGMPGQPGQRPQYPLGAYPGQPGGYPGQPQPQIRYNANVRNQQPQQMPGGAGGQQAMVGGGSDSLLPGAMDAAAPLTIKELASAPEEARKQMIGERLFPLVRQHNASLAGKITGMLLEMDNGELLHLLESAPSLQDKVQEAMQVLEQNPTDE